MQDDNYQGKERRQYFRYKHSAPIHYKIVTSSKRGGDSSGLIDAVSRNLSASGILFTSDHLPELSSILLVDLDYRTTRVCQEIEELALIVNNKLLGKIVRIEDNDDGSYDIGVAFVKKTDGIPANIKKLLD